MSKEVRLLSLPVLGRYWLYHAWQETSRSRSSPALKHWREGAGLEERASLLLKSLQIKGWEKLLKQWQGVELAKDRTFKNYLYRLAQFVLAREDPNETFLKSVPTQLQSLRIIYPTSVSSTAVRRRLRLLTKQRLQHHKLRMILWSLTSAPLCLLLLTPLPALPVYYALYRAFSHYQALSGCKSLATAMSHHDNQQLLDLRRRLLDMQLQGHKFDPMGWPAHVLQNSRLPDQSNSVSEGPKQAQDHHQQHVVPVLQPSADLDRFVQPHVRLKTPLTDEAVLHVGSHFGITGLLSHVAKARRQLKLVPNAK